MFRDGDEILLQSRDEKPLNRYFPELIAPLTATLPERCVVDGEIVIVVVYGPGDLFFESGDVNHTVFNKTDAPMVHVLFEILPMDCVGPSLIPVKPA